MSSGLVFKIIQRERSSQNESMHLPMSVKENWKQTAQ